jgi:DoxX
MTTSEEAIPIGRRPRITWIREWLARFPLSVLQLGMRVGVGMVFFKAGLLKYQSFEFAVKLFEDEYKVPLLPPAVAARMAMINELTTLLFRGLATRLTTLPLLGMISGHPDFRVSQRVAGPCSVGIDPHFSSDTRTRSALSR